MQLIFVSGVQKELAAERRSVRDFVRGDPLLRKHFDVFLFEDLPPTDRRPDDLYLDYVDRSTVYLGVYGTEYGSEDNYGVSPTEREFDRATLKGLNRLVFVLGASDAGRHEKMRALIAKAGRELLRRRFTDTESLLRLTYASLVDHLERTGVIATRRFDETAPLEAGMQDVSPERLRWFLDRARVERNSALDPNAPAGEALAHLNLLEDGRPSNGALLLFGRNPQKWVPGAETKCLHFHGSMVEKPIPSYQVFQGDLFSQVDQAVDFVLTKLQRQVGARDSSSEAPVAYDIPARAIREAIVNAIAHRDYTSAAAVQVYIFADRIEVWNPGALPVGITLEDLRHPHSSHPRYPRIADPLFLAHYIEKAGTGTLEMIDQCRAQGLPEPEFREQGNQFVLTLWRDWLTPDLLARLNVSARQAAGLAHVKAKGRITNREYQELVGVGDRTALRDLDELVSKGVLAKIGGTGRGTYYVLGKKPAANPTNQS